MVEALTGKRPKVYLMKNGKMIMECGREHLEGFRRYAELAEAIKVAGGGKPPVAAECRPPVLFIQGYLSGSTQSR